MRYARTVKTNIYKFKSSLKYESFLQTYFFISYTLYKSSLYFRMRQFNLFSILFPNTDIKECSQTSKPCHQNANCTELQGSFNCSCSQGYIGNGTYCEGWYNIIIITISMYKIAFWRFLLPTHKTFIPSFTVYQFTNFLKKGYHCFQINFVT